MEENNELIREKTEDEIDLLAVLRSFIRGFLRFWWLIVLLALIGGAAALISAHKKYVPMYRSQATFTVATNMGELGEDVYSFYYDSARADQLGLTFPYILSSELLQDAMKEDMGTESINGSVSAKTISNSNMVTMYAVSADPETAKAILESALRVYPRVSRFVIGDTKFNMIDVPDLPQKPYNTPDYKKKTAQGALLGLLVGLAGVAVYAFLRRTVQNTDELQQMMNLPCLTSLPLIKQKAHKKHQEAFPSVLSKKISPWFSENMETLRLRVTKEMESKGKKVLLVTSTMAGEGKSVVSANLAFKFAQQGKSVLLVDADLRKQNLAKAIGIFPEYGIEDVASGRCSPAEALTFNERNKIYFLGGSKPMEHTSNVFSRKLKLILEELKQQVDYVILDAPPCGAFEDVFLMEEYSDAILYVVKQDYAPKTKVLEGIASLESEEAPVIGYVFNGVSGVWGSYGYYGYGKYGYGKYGYGKYGRYGYGYGRKENEGE